jgi:hypothetical protein
MTRDKAIKKMRDEGKVCLVYYLDQQTKFRINLGELQFHLQDTWIEFHNLRWFLSRDFDNGWEEV